MYSIRKVITVDNANQRFNIGSKWYAMDSRFSSLGLSVENTHELSKAVHFDTEDEATSYMNTWFIEGWYRVIKLKSKESSK